jgi:hypothetical protein
MYAGYTSLPLWYHCRISLQSICLLIYASLSISLAAASARCSFRWSIQADEDDGIFRFWSDTIPPSDMIRPFLRFYHLLFSRLFIRTRNDDVLRVCLYAASVDDAIYLRTVPIVFRCDRSISVPSDDLQIFSILTYNSVWWPSSLIFQEKAADVVYRTPTDKQRGGESPQQNVENKVVVVYYSV